MRKYAFGVDIGGTTVKLGLFETSGNLIDKWEIKTRLEDNGSYILNDIANTIKDKLIEKDISKLDIEGIGMGVPGPVTSDGIVHRCVNLGWGVINIETEMSRITGMKVKIGNDANVAALGEMWQGGGKGYDDLVMITLGTGVGGGVIINGKIVGGSTGAGGEIGHIHMKDEETETCGCGKSGCLEQYASATGIVNSVKKYLNKSNDTNTNLSDIKELTAKDIFDAAKDGDSVANKFVDETADLLGKASAQISCVINPQVFVVGGGMAKAGSMILQKIEDSYKKYAFHASRDTYFKLAELGNDAGIYGGVKLVLE